MGVRKTHDQFVEELQSKTGDEYKVLNEYEDSRTKVHVEHTVCNHKYYVLPFNILRGKRCPKCYRPNYKLNTDDFINEIYEIFQDEFLVMGEYKGRLEKVKMKHNICGYEWDVLPINILGRQGCPRCSGLERKTTDSFKREVYGLTTDEYSVLGDYKNNRTKIAMQHNECGYKYDVSPDMFLEGKRCPLCHSSKNEKLIYYTLKKYNIECIKEYRSKGCENKKGLIFDFCIEDSVFLEYDGELHFKPARFSKDKDEMVEKLKGNQNRDSIKNIYCIENNIPLIRIPYWEQNNIEKIVEDVLKYFNIIEGNCENPSIVEKYYVRDGWDQDEYISKY